MLRVFLILVFCSLNLYADDLSIQNNTKLQLQNKDIQNLQTTQENLKNDIKFLQKQQIALQSQEQYLDLRKDVLDDRSSWVNWLLIIFTLIAIAVPFIIRIFNNKVNEYIKDSKQDIDKFIKTTEQTAEQHLEELKNHVKTAEEKVASIGVAPENINTNKAKDIIAKLKESDNKLEQEIAKAIDLQGNDKLQESIDKWKNIEGVAKYKGNDEILEQSYFYQGYLFNELKDFDKAIKSYKKAIEIDLENDSSYSNIANTYVELKDFKNAIKSCKKAIKIKPKKDGLYYNMGIIYSKFKDFKNAIESYKEAIEIKPQNDEAYSGIGIAYAGLGEFDKAIESFNKAIEINSDNTIAKDNLAELEKHIKN